MIKIVGLLLVCFYLSAFGLEIKCPSSIQTTQSISESLSDGWDSFDDKLNGQKNFDYIQVFDGHPSEGASLVPDNENSKKDPYWTNQTLKGFWVACYYRQSTVRLVKSIPKNVKRCTYKSKTRQKKETKTFDKLICL